MAYNNNVPLGNQTIASTTDPIRNNFAFLQSSIGQEHNFDNTDATNTYHLKASMPNQADPGSLPAGTNGMYYVNSGKPKFYDGTTASFFQIGSQAQIITSGVVALNSASSTTVVSVPSWSFGYFLLSPASSSGLSVPNRYSLGFVASSASSLKVSLDTGSSLLVAAVGLDIKATTGSPASNGNYNFVLAYFTP